MTRPFVLDSTQLWVHLSRLPLVASGRSLHRAALQALTRGRLEEAWTLFERGAARYRAQLQIEPLARLRVHQLIARVRAGLSHHEESALALEVDRRLARLERIESLEPPFELVDARRLLATWQSSPMAAPESPTDRIEGRAAA
ncbi:MAG: hypothetical protein A2W00_06955 [Candidatus Eisenbacteria bacterium RBG_16_71_46]|nr:MAG: hypothetical protein A2W00_06955 [Candidatus Eisenbacteria bacterium RBG_16_71_46]